jgi:hypothetical protein
VMSSRHPSTQNNQLIQTSFHAAQDQFWLDLQVHNWARLLQATYREKREWHFEIF